MITSVLAFLTVLIPLALAIYEGISGHRQRERDKQRRLAKVEADETDAAMARVDAELDKLRVKTGDK